MRSKKNGIFDLAIMPTFATILAVVVVMSALLWYAHNIENQTAFQKRFLATDLALLMDTVYAMPQPGNLFVIYTPQHSPEFNTNFSYKFGSEGANYGSNKVEVSEKDNDPKKGTAFFTPRKGFVAEEADLKFKKTFIVPMIIKQNMRIAINDINKRDFYYDRNTLTCPSTKFTKKFEVNASVGGIDENLAKMLAASNVVEMQQVAPGPSVSTLRLVAGNEPVVKAYINGNARPQTIIERQRVACEIINSVLQYFDSKNILIEETAVVPINPAHTAAKDDDNLAMNDVLLRLGPMASFADLDFQRGLANAMKEGITNAKS